MKNSIIKLMTPLSDPVLSTLKVGQEVQISGNIFTARDAAHHRICNASPGNFPIDWKGQILYYCGPSPAKPGQPIGSAGPTTSGRMDGYTPFMLETLGVRGMIGKGPRSQKVIESIVKTGSVYFAAIGGAGALLAKSVEKASVVLFPELGPEAVYCLNVTNFPAVVAIDSFGGNLYSDNRSV